MSRQLVMTEAEEMACAQFADLPLAAWRDRVAVLGFQVVRQRSVPPPCTSTGPLPSTLTKVDLTSDNPWRDEDGDVEDPDNTVGL